MRFPKVRKYQIGKMRERHQEMKRLIVLGMKSTEIARELDCTPENVCAVTGSELFRREIDVLRVARDSLTVDVSQRIIEIGVKGLDLLDEVVEGIGQGKGVDIGLRIRVAMDALDRSSKSAKVKTVQGDIKHTHLVEDSVLDRIKLRAKEAGMIASQAGMVEEDAEVVYQEVG